MAERKENTVAESLSSQKGGTPQTPKMEIDFESLIAAGIAAAVIKPSKKWRNRSRSGETNLIYSSRADTGAPISRIGSAFVRQAGPSEKEWDPCSGA
jgi:hypothetical protein